MELDMDSDGLEVKAAIEIGSEFKVYNHFEASLKQLEHDTGTLFVKKTTHKVCVFFMFFFFPSII